MPRRALLIIIVLLVAFSCIRVVQLEQRKERLKQDRIELCHIKYGLFNVDEWKTILAGIITKKINELKITKENRPEMKRQVEDVLRRVLAEVEVVIEQQGRQRGVKGWLRNQAMDMFDVMADVKKGIPQYADMLLDYIENPENKKALKGHLITKLNEFADKTGGQVDYTEFNAILARYESVDKASCVARIDEQRVVLDSEERLYFILLGAAFVALLAVILAGGKHTALELGLLATSAVFLLISGLALPMIDIEATISSFSFTLVGEPVEFKDQVLFFQSKSILQVVALLLKNGGVGLVVVALLVFTFSVLIPFAKLIASMITLVRSSAPKNALLRFLVFKSGKWSMADVMVVAIFMSYIGFNGVINSQLTQITAFSSNVQVFTTNNSVLQAGFYLFASYCVIGLVLSAMIEKRLVNDVT